MLKAIIGVVVALVVGVVHPTSLSEEKLSRPVEAGSGTKRQQVEHRLPSARRGVLLRRDDLPQRRGGDSEAHP